MALNASNAALLTWLHARLHVRHVWLLQISIVRCVLHEGGMILAQFSYTIPDNRHDLRSAEMNGPGESGERRVAVLDRGSNLFSKSIWTFLKCAQHFRALPKFTFDFDGQVRLDYPHAQILHTANKIVCHCKTLAI